MSNEETLNLIVIDDSTNDLELVSNMLRNAGHPVHTRRVEDDDDLRDALTDQQWELILAKPQIPYFTAHGALAVLERKGEDLPILVLTDDMESDQVEEALEAGAHDAVSMGQSRQLVRTVLREVAAVRDRRRLRTCQAALEHAEERAHDLTESSRDAIAYIQDGMHVYANPAYLDLFGYNRIDELAEASALDMVVPDDQGRLKDFLRTCAKTGNNRDQLTVHGQRLDGSVFEMLMELSPVTYNDEPCFQIIIRDQSVSRELERKLDDLSKHDLLTGTYNRQHFLDRVRQDVGTGQHQGAVLYIRPDDFRTLSDEIGVAASDMLIADMATALQKLLPSGDHMLARFEAFTFTILYHNADETEAKALADRIVQAIADQLWEAGGRTVDLHCSVGIALYDTHSNDPQRILFHADKARRTAAENGGNQSRLYSTADEQEADQQQRQLWAQQLKQALKNDNFRLLYQPIVNLQDERTEAYEVLLRLLDDQDHEIAASNFFPVAEELGLANAIDRWVILRAMKVLAERRQGGQPVRFFVKLSGQSLTDTGFLPWLSQLRQNFRMDPGALVLEVHEETAHNNLKAVRRFGEGLEALHIQLALDHFGYESGWEHLMHELPTRYVKVHADLIRNLATNKADQERLKAIVSHARQAGVFTVAQFVETANTLAVLWGTGVDYVEGYFLQPPGKDLTYDFAATV